MGEEMKEVINASVLIHFDDGESEFFINVEGIKVESDFIYIAMTDGEGAMVNKNRVKYISVKDFGRNK